MLRAVHTSFSDETRTALHAMERTPKALASRPADGSASKFKMTSTLKPQAARALVCRRSSCSR
jgi:hypothetical protein